MHIDLAMLNPETPGDPTLGPDVNSIFLVYANMGMAVTYRKFFAGISVNDIALTNDIPVSYTHLDVYKRQLLCKSR